MQGDLWWLILCRSWIAVDFRLRRDALRLARLLKLDVCLTIRGGCRDNC